MTAEQKRLVRLNVDMRLAGLFADMRAEFKPRIVRDVVRIVKERQSV